VSDSNIDQLKTEVLAVLKTQVSSLGVELRADLEPYVEAIAHDAVEYAQRAVLAQDGAADIYLGHLKAQAEMLGAIATQRTGQAMSDTLITVAEVAARILGAALKAML
jgi:hypothetical protein